MVWDFFQYWFHRWQHTSSTLWPSHRVHHSDDRVNTTTALRRSVLELLLIFVFILVPTVIVAGVDEVAAPIAFAIFYGWGFFNHANIRLPLGPLTAIFSGPQWHRLHHAIDPDCRDQFRRVFSDPRYRVRHLPRSAPARVSRDRRDRLGCHRAPVPRLPAAPPHPGGCDMSAVAWRYALTNALMVAFVSALAHGGWPVWVVAGLAILIGGAIDEAVGDEHEHSGCAASWFFDLNLYATLPLLVVITLLLLQATLAGGSTVVAAAIGAGYSMRWRGSRSRTS
jgi:hypothetical protein